MHKIPYKIKKEKNIKTCLKPARSLLLYNFFNSFLSTLVLYQSLDISFLFSSNLVPQIHINKMLITLRL